MTSNPTSKGSLSHFPLSSLINSRPLQSCVTQQSLSITPEPGALQQCWTRTVRAPSAFQMRNRYKNAIMAALLCWNRRPTQTHLFYATGKMALAYYFFYYYSSLRMTTNLSDTPGEGRGEHNPHHSHEDILSNYQCGLLAFSLSFNIHHT